MEDRNVKLSEDSVRNAEAVYLASDIQAKLNIGRSKTYEFLDEICRLDNPPFRVIKIGRLYRVPCRSFDNWLNAG